MRVTASCGTDVPEIVMEVVVFFRNGGGGGVIGSVGGWR